MSQRGLSPRRGRRMIVYPFKGPQGGGDPGTDGLFPMGGATFIAPFLDGGNGSVNTGLVRGQGVATFTRATAAASRLSNGTWNLNVASGTPRSHYSDTGVYLGYLAENAATQLLTNPRDMTQVAWVKVTMTTAQTSTGLDGVANSCTRITATGANSTILQTLVAAASSRTYSCYIKRITGTGAIGICQDGATFTDVTASVPADSKFHLVQLNASQLNAVFGIRLVTSGDAVDVDCNQFEAGTYATTPIPAAGTRNLDSLTYVTSGNQSDTAGTCYAEVAPGTLAPFFGRIVGQTAANPDLLEFVSNDATHPTTSFDGTTTLAGPAVAAVAVDTVFKAAVTWLSGGNFRLFTKGSAGTPGAYDGAYSLGQIAIGLGSGGNTALGGCVKNVRIWNYDLPASTVQILTT